MTATYFYIDYDDPAQFVTSARMVGSGIYKTVHEPENDFDSCKFDELWFISSSYCTTLIHRCISDPAKINDAVDEYIRTGNSIINASISAVK